MSKLISACFRKEPPKDLSLKLDAICNKIEPDNIKANKPKLICNQSGATAIMNPVETILIHEASVLLGHIAKENGKSQWHRVNSYHPDGSYAVFRNSNDICEVVTDAVASRTVWYYFDDNIFLSGTSQRAIILFLGNFEFNEGCIPWMLSTGSLGPQHSWDKRIKRLQPSTSAILDKDRWELKIKKRPVVFKSAKKRRIKHEDSLRFAIKSTFENIEFDFNQWILPLSGGYDSRAILYSLLKKADSPKKPHTITWGLKKSIKIEGNDAFVAKKVADTLDISHKYYHTDVGEESIKDILNRFIRLGEGRIDHLGGYMDGFKLWKNLFEDGVQGIIRGDELFGLGPVESEIRVKYHVGCALCTDFINLKDYRKFNIPQQEFPRHLKRKPKESLSSWRDRLSHEFRTPGVLAALSDLKLGYVEQTSPFLSHKILESVRQLPDKFRTKKVLFRRVVGVLKPTFEYATKGANKDLASLLKDQSLQNLLKTELESEYAKSIIAPEFIERIVRNLNTEKSVKRRKIHGIIPLIKKNTPRFVKKLWGTRPYLSVDNNLLALRLYITISMHKLLHNEFNDLNFPVENIKKITFKST